MTRVPVVSGTFYPADAKEITCFLDSSAPRNPSKHAAKGIILPHAGYVYSGAVAAATVARALPREKIIILGPNHTGEGQPFSLYSGDAWETPLGAVPVDKELASAILEGEGPLREDADAHRGEHSIEVELPVLQHFFKEFTCVPICCMTQATAVYARAAEQIYNAVAREKNRILIVASSDMTHYEPDAAARRKDRLAIEQILRLDAQGLIDTVKKEHSTMCGIAPVAIMLILTKLLGATKAEVVRYQTSGDASGDYTSVVGYLGAIIT